MAPLLVRASLAPGGGLLQYRGDVAGSVLGEAPAGSAGDVVSEGVFLQAFSLPTVGNMIYPALGNTCRCPLRVVPSSALAAIAHPHTNLHLSLADHQMFLITSMFILSKI